MIKRIADRTEESDDKKSGEQPASSEPAPAKEPEPCFHRSSAIMLAHRGVKPRGLVVAKSSVTKRAPLVAAEETVTTSRVTGRGGTTDVSRLQENYQQCQQPEAALHHMPHILGTALCMRCVPEAVQH
ncbi:hypothetical protein MRX96_005778 [Rhipicephalus microplus]